MRNTAEQSMCAKDSMLPSSSLPASVSAEPFLSGETSSDVLPVFGDLGLTTLVVGETGALFRRTITGVERGARLAAVRFAFSGSWRFSPARSCFCSSIARARRSFFVGRFGVLPELGTDETLTLCSSRNSLSSPTRNPSSSSTLGILFAITPSQQHRSSADPGLALLPRARLALFLSLSLSLSFFLALALALAQSFARTHTRCSPRPRPLCAALSLTQASSTFLRATLRTSSSFPPPSSPNSPCSCALPPRSPLFLSERARWRLLVSRHLRLALRDRFRFLFAPNMSSSRIVKNREKFCEIFLVSLFSRSP
mmetsp:Transcript_214/g.554  ORF Transcript_214/g.554 Transcript_214/m.554 type:complete len:311 (+) Transcript_214:151-1083(+)